MFQTTNQKSNDSATQIAMVTTITPGWVSMESHKSHVPNHQPEIQWFSYPNCYGYNYHPWLDFYGKSFLSHVPNHQPVIINHD